MSWASASERLILVFQPLNLPPPSSIGARPDDDGEDRISVLPDHLLIEILQRLDLRAAVRAGAASTRWRHLPHQCTSLRLDVRDFHSANRTTPLEAMKAYTATAWRLLSAFPPACRHCNRSRAVTYLRLTFFLPDPPQLRSIGHVVEHVVSRGDTESLKFSILPPPTSNPTSSSQLAAWGQQLMSFSRAYHVVFRWLTKLALKKLAFGDSDVADLIVACDKLRCLSMRSCRLVNRHSALKIDTPGSAVQKLEFTGFGCTRIELISVPKLRKVRCHNWHRLNPPVRFGYVPELDDVSLASRAKTWQAPFALSECFSRRSPTNLWKMQLNFSYQMIWIQPEHPMELTTIFSNLMKLNLFGIFPECDLSWTLFFLEASPSLQYFALSRTRHLCLKTSEDSAAKTNVVWEPSKDFKHLNLKWLVMKGFEEEDKVTNYVRLVMERATVLTRIMLRGKHDTCKKCDAIDLESASRFLVDEARRQRIKERLMHESSSSVEIILC